MINDEVVDDYRNIAGLLAVQTGDYAALALWRKVNVEPADMHLIDMHGCFQHVEP